MVKYLSGRVKRTPQDQLRNDRYEYLNLEQAEPNLADPPTPTSEIPPGSQFQLVSIPGHPGRRYWVPLGGGLTQGSITIFDEGSQVSGTSSITQLNFVGAAVTAEASVQSPSGHPGIAATITVIPVTVGDTPPIGAGTTNNGELWWESDTGDLYVYYNDGNTSQWVQANAGGRGLAGDKGEKGEPSTQQGPEGDKGNEGQKGEAGNVLAKGVKGEPGVDGQDGQDGDKGDQGIKGIKGDLGLKGNTGDQGVKGEKGEVGVQGDKAGILYNFSNANTMVDPNAGNFRFNSSTLSSVNQISIDALDKNGNDFSNFITTWDDANDVVKGTLSIKSNDNSDTSHVIFQVTSVTDNTGFLIIGVQNGVGNIPSNLETCVLNFSRAGDKGITGDKGVTDKITEGNTEAEVVDTGTNGHFKVTTEGQERLRITSGGDVLTSGTSQLFGSNTSDGSDNKSIMINGGGSTSDTRGGYLLVHGNEHASKPGTTRLHAGNVGTAGIEMYTKGSERFRITSTGKVGIGSISPGTTLDLQSGDTETLLRLNTKPSKNGYLDIVSDADRRGVIRFKDTDGTDRWSIGNGDSDELTNTSFHISTGDSGGNTAKLIIDSNGNVRIGTAGAPNLAVGDGLEIERAGAATIRIEDSSSGSGFEIQNTGGVIKQRLYNNQPWTIEYGGGEKLRIASAGQIGLSGANYGTAGQVLTSQGGSSAPTWTTQINTQLTTEQVEDIVGDMFSGNTETRITAEYADNGTGRGKINLVVDDQSADNNTTYSLDVPTGTSNPQVVLNGSDSSSDGIELVPGTNMTITRVNGGAISFSSTDTNTDTTYLLKAQQTDGNNNDPNLFLDASSGTDDTIKLVGGTNVTVTRDNDGQITFSSTDTNTTYDLLVPSGTTKIRLDPSDGSGNDDIEIAGGSNVTVTRNNANKLTISSTDTNTNTTYLLKAQQVSGSNNNPNLFLDASSGTDDTVRLVGGTNVTVTRDNDGQITFSSTDTNTNTTYDLLVPSGTTAIRLDPSDSSGNDDITITGGTNISVTRTSDSELTINTSATVTATNLLNLSRIQFGPGASGSDDANFEWLGGSNDGYLRISVSDDSDSSGTSDEYIELGDYAIGGSSGANLSSTFTQWAKLARDELTMESIVRTKNDLYIDEALRDKDGQTGSNGQVLVSTGSQVNWVNSSSVGQNTTYSLKAQQTSGNNDNPNIFLDASSGTDDSIQLIGGTNCTITRNNDGQITFDSVNTNTQLTTEQVQDIVGAMFTGNTETRITATYQDSDGTIDLVVVDQSADNNTTYDLITSASGSNVNLKLDASSGDDDTILITAGSNVSFANVSTTGFTINTSATLDVTQLNLNRIRFGPGNAVNDDANIEWLGSNNSGYLRISTSDDGGAEYIELGDYDNIDLGGSFTRWMKLNRTELYMDRDVRLNAGLEDKDGQKGSNGQVLVSTGSQVNWVNSSSVGNNTTYSISCVNGDNTDEEKIRLTDSNGGTDDVVLEAGTGLTISRSGDKITFTNNDTGSSSGSNVATSSNPPGSPSDGDLWWDTDDGDLHIYYDDGSGSPSAQWVSIGASGQKGEKGDQGQSGTMIVNARTSGYSAVASDNGKLITMTTGDLTISSNVFSAGDAVTVANLSNSAFSIIQGSGVLLYLTGTTVTGNRSLAAKGLCTLVCVSANTFFVSGGGVT